MTDFAKPKCENRNHYEDLFLFGVCGRCSRIFSLPAEEDAVATDGNETRPIDARYTTNQPNV